MQNSIDTIGSLFLNQVREESESNTNFSDLVLHKMTEFNFPIDKSNDNWNKVGGHDINHMIKNIASTNSFFIVANQYFDISIIIINSRGNIVVMNDQSRNEPFSPFHNDEYLYIYSKKKQKQRTHISYVKNLQKEVQTQKIKKVKKGKKLL